MLANDYLETSTAPDAIKVKAGSNCLVFQPLPEDADTTHFVVEDYRITIPVSTNDVAVRHVVSQLEDHTNVELQACSNKESGAVLIIAGKYPRGTLATRVDQLPMAADKYFNLLKTNCGVALIRDARIELLVDWLCYG